MELSHSFPILYALISPRPSASASVLDSSLLCQFLLQAAPASASTECLSSLPASRSLPQCMAAGLHTGSHSGRYWSCSPCHPLQQ